MPKTIALSGWKFSGKDAVATHLMSEYAASRFAFADPMKDMAAEEYNVPRNDFDDPTKKEQPLLNLPVNPQDSYTRMISEFLIKEFRTADGKRPNSFTKYTNEGILCDGNGVVTYDKVYWTPRALAILKGSTNRAVRADYWVKKTIASINFCSAWYAVISDLRYKSELNQIKEAFGEDLITIRINRFDTSPSTDPSERDLDDHKFDFVVENKGTKEELYQKIDEILETLK